MVSFDVKKESTTSSPLNQSTSQDKHTLSFSDLLKGVESNKDTKVVQNGALVLSLDDSAQTESTKTASKKTDTLLSLLSNEEAVKTPTKDTLELNPALTQTLNVKELKALVADAKEYLKSKILQSDEYKLSQIKDLPKTLKGLSQLAKNIGIDISKITIQEVQAKSLSKDEALKIEQKVQTVDVTKEAAKADVKVQAVDVTKEAAKADAKVQAADVANLKEIPKEIKSTPLFKAQTVTEHTTEQFVQTKQFKVEEKTPKVRADETLKLLLRGEKPSLANSGLTADFSVSTAKVLVSNASTALENLLRGESSESKGENSAASKTDGLSVHKADSFEVKLNEAKQMIKYLSNDVKTAIEDYKSPFTRIKVQLNPQKLGEIDLTVVQRGNNLHVNLSSNNAAINTLVMNANELRTQLNNSGINNASLNFNNQPDGGNSNSGQPHHRDEKEARQEYNHFDNEESNEEVLSSLEIVVPRYI